MNSNLNRFILAKFFSIFPKGRRKYAFTLAEVLITLGIIGVVAAMTLPVIQTKMDERANMTSLKKFYTEFSTY